MDQEFLNVNLHYVILTFENTFFKKRVRIQNQLSVSYSQCTGEHFEQKTMDFDFFFFRYAFLTKDKKNGSFKKSIFYHLDIKLYTQRNIYFRDEMFLEISVRENVYLRSS